MGWFGLVFTFSVCVAANADAQTSEANVAITADSADLALERLDRAPTDLDFEDPRVVDTLSLPTSIARSPNAIFRLVRTRPGGVDRTAVFDASSLTESRYRIGFQSRSQYRTTGAVLGISGGLLLLIAGALAFATDQLWTPPSGLIIARSALASGYLLGALFAVPILATTPDRAILVAVPF